MTWVGATSGSTNDAAHNYNNTANWAGGVIDDSFSGVSLSSATTIYLTANRATGSSGLNLGYSGDVDLTIKSSSTTTRTLTLGGEIVGNFGGANNRTVTLGDSAAKVNLDLGGTARTFNVVDGDTLNLMNPASNGGVTKTGTGTLVLGGSNSFTGGLVVKNGTASATVSGGLGAGTLTLGDSSGSANATVFMAGNFANYANAITVQSGSSGTATLGGTTSNPVTLSGCVTLNHELVLAMNSTGTLTISGGISGPSGLVNRGTGSGGVIISGVLDSTVGSVTEDSASSNLKLSGNNSGYGNGVSILAGSLTSSSNAYSLGTGTVQLGGTSGSADATLYVGTGIANAVNVRAGSSGTVTIQSINTSGFSGISGTVTLARDLVVRRIGSSGGGFSLTGGTNGV